jgi:hypothetical protein
MAGIPSDRDLRELSLRAVVCYVVRILKRLAPEFYRLRDDATRYGVEQLLKQAEAFCRGDEADRGRFAQSVNQVQYGQQPLSSVAYLAGSTGWGILNGDSSIVCRAMIGIAKQLSCMRSELQRDFEQLQRIYHRATETGAPIDPFESGPLGSLWNNSPSRAVPQSFWDDAATMRRDRQRRMAAVLAAQPHRERPEVLIQAAIVTFGDKASDGQLIVGVALPWFDILREIERNPDFLFQFAKNPRRFEEFIAGAYERSGFTDVILTPQSADRGRDIILTATMPGVGQLQLIDETKAYSPGHKVTAKDVSRLYWALQRDQSTKGIVTTTSEFAQAFSTSSKHYCLIGLSSKMDKSFWNGYARLPHKSPLNATT